MAGLLNCVLVLLAVATSTLAAVEPPSGPSMGNWTVNHCIVVNMAGKLSISKTDNATEAVEVNVPATANATGECNPNNQTITLSWTEAEPKTKNILHRNLTILFLRNDTATPPVYGVKNIAGVYETMYFQKNVTVDNTTKEETFVQYVGFTTFSFPKLELQTPVNRSYLCLNIGKFSMHAERHDSSEAGGAPGELVANSTFTAQNVQFDAFRPDNIPSNILQTPLDCSFRPSDVVPIVVGCALAGTVLLVLIAYLVGRRRNRARGYQSV